MPRVADVYVSDIEIKRERRRRILFLAIAVAALYGSLVFIIWFLLYSDALRVKEVKIIGNSAVPSRDILELMRAMAFTEHRFSKAILGYRNMLVWPERLDDAALAFFPKIQDIQINKDYGGRTITVTVKEKEQRGVWCFAGSEPAECFWFDAEGKIFERSFSAEGSLVFTIFDATQTRLSLGSRVLPESQVGNLISVIQALEETAVTVKELRYENQSLQEIKALPYEGPEIRFSLRFSAKSIVPVLEKLIADRKFRGLKTIDFTAENRVYYK